MRISKSIIYLGLISLAGCTSLKVVTDQLEGTDFSKFRTYQIMEPETVGGEKIYFNQLNRNRVKNAVKEQMEVRNYELAEEADLNVHIYVKTETKMDVVPVPSARYGGYRYWGYESTGVRSYKEGTLIIDLVDVSSGNLVWHGVAVKTIDGPYKDMEERIRKVVVAIFDKYPYMAGPNTSEYQ